MSDPYYCKLYIDTDEDEGDLELALADAAASAFADVRVEYPVYPNDDFDPSSRARMPYDFIQCSRYYVELGTLERAAELPDFQSGVAVFVRSLRDNGRIVTAACDFEELIADATGWNWSESTPEPPGRRVES
ncbi:hypothetical protein HY29_17860 [Hyphomonas beringensis]|uniref:Uncharacterized protein n=1 Tax=Hyphomonas beringensis TaxID=1280946 RepID=A0A062TXY0_9PROT|nr:hypothetical protein HY29_17860 [Hyphomonas beringensis]